MTVHHAPHGTGSRHPQGFMILTPSQLEVTAGEEFTSSVTVWPAGPHHHVTASVPADSGLEVRVAGHKVTVTGRLTRTGEQHTVLVHNMDDMETAHDTLTITATATSAQR